MKLGKRRYSMNSIAVARGCSCYTMCTCKNRQSLKSYYNIKTTITETVQQREFRQNQRRGGCYGNAPFFIY